MAELHTYTREYLARSFCVLEAFATVESGSVLLCQQGVSAAQTVAKPAAPKPAAAPAAKTAAAPAKPVAEAKAAEAAEPTAAEMQMRDVNTQSLANTASIVEND